MDPQTTETFVRIRILEVLDQFRGMPCREDSLADQLEMMLAAVRLTREQLAAQLEDLRKAGFIEYEIPKLGPTQWRITPQGKAEYHRYRYDQT